MGYFINYESNSLPPGSYEFIPVGGTALILFSFNQAAIQNTSVELTLFQRSSRTCVKLLACNL